MTYISKPKEDGTGRYLGNERVVRDDAVKYQDRYMVPTSKKTQWVTNWQEFRNSGGQLCFNEDHTEIELLLPEPYKFSVKFMDQEKVGG